MKRPREDTAMTTEDLLYRMDDVTDSTMCSENASQYIQELHAQLRSETHFRWSDWALSQLF